MRTSIVAVWLGLLLVLFGTACGGTVVNNGVPTTGPQEQPIGADSSTESSQPSDKSDDNAKPCPDSRLSEGQRPPANDPARGGVANYVDNRNGVQVYDGDTPAPFHGQYSHACFGERIVVKCYDPNPVGLPASVPETYLIVGGRFNGGRIPAAVMLNDDYAKLGDATTANRHPRVHECP
jgi:hypothetical protein